MPESFSVSSEVREHADHKVVVLSLKGSMDAAATRGLEAAFGAAGDAKAQCFVFDFSGVEYISSAGLRLLLKFRKAALGIGGSVKVAALHRSIRENVFDALGFSRLFDVYATVDDAIGSLGRP